jgi:A/G-specific adenine glycosylase
MDLKQAQTNQTLEGAIAATEWLATHSDLLPRLRFSILSYFEHSGRGFPWRKTNDPYKILLAEILLQKTGAKPVIQVWNNFLIEFPNLVALSMAKPSDVEELIRPLGLLKRAQVLVSIAQIIVNEYSGKIPSSESALQSIPGIGPYTSAAIMSFAYDIRVATIDVNANRVYTRIAGFIPNTLRQASAFSQIIGKEIVSDRDHKSINWGVLDLSSQICKPHPNCQVCPTRKICSYCGGK